jgi:predicted Zn-dependent protease
MAFMSQDEAMTILEKVVGISKAEECTATIEGAKRGNIRFALNNVSTSGVVSDTSLSVQVAYGRRTGSASINAFDDASLERVVRRAEELALLAPENPEFVPAVEKQDYRPSATFSKATADITPAQRAEIAAQSIERCRAEKLVAAGFLNDSHRFMATLNSKGNRGFQESTRANYSCTVRTADDRGSGWVINDRQDISGFSAGDEVQVAMRKAAASADARALEPGKYTVILEPAAAAGLISFMMRYFDARQADEGRSFLSKKGGGTKLGEQVFDPRVTIVSDPADPLAAVMPWDGQGLARVRRPLVENGKVSNLEYSRFWAARQGVTPAGTAGNIIMSGGTKSTADLVRETERGILITRTWYIRLVDPQTVLLTGLTRDGTFYIENGQIRYPLKNFRFNESPVIMLNNIDELGRPVRTASDESQLLMVVPPMRLRDFTFTSLSDAV